MISLDQAPVVKRMDNAIHRIKYLSSGKNSTFWEHLSAR